MSPYPASISLAQGYLSMDVNGFGMVYFPHLILFVLHNFVSSDSESKLNPGCISKDVNCSIQIRQPHELMVFNKANEWEREKGWKLK